MSRNALWPVVLVLAGCARQLMPTPNLYVGSGSNPFADVPAVRRSNEVDLLFVTDREPVPGKTGGQRYGFGRSPSLAFGSCIVEIGDDVPWDVLVANSRTHTRTVPLRLTVRSVTEQARFPATPLLLSPGSDPPSVVPDVAERQQKVMDTLHAELARRLAETPRKEAFIFIHGYHDTFEHAAFVAAELWHFLGREGVPVLYTWPAGHGGLLQGYEYDRESGSFTVFHLRKFIRALAACPELERISILAHSRGTAVAADALRALMIAARAAGEDPIDAFKLGNLVLAAPDIDLMVATQQFGGDRLSFGVKRATIYASKHDKALSVASWLEADGERLGQVEPGDLTPFERAVLEGTQRLTIVDVHVPRKGWGHSYFHTSPAVSSDVILLFRYDRDPGAAHGRPLTHEGGHFWWLEEGYPAVE